MPLGNAQLLQGQYNSLAWCLGPSIIALPPNFPIAFSYLSGVKPDVSPACLWTFLAGVSSSLTQSFLPMLWLAHSNLIRPSEQNPSHIHVQGVPCTGVSGQGRGTRLNPAKSCDPERGCVCLEEGYFFLMEEGTGQGRVALPVLIE